MKNHFWERDIQLSDGSKGKKKAELFDLCKKAAAMKQFNYLPLLETARAVGGENENEFGQISKMTHSAAPHVPLFCSYHILTSSVIYY